MTGRRRLPSGLAASLAAAWLLHGARGWSPFGWGGPSPTEVIFGSVGMNKHATDDLNAGNFPRFLEEHPVTAVLFYAPWCFYSQQMMPAWDLAAQKLQLHDPPVKLAKIDTHRYGAIGDAYGVNAFPTMKLFVDGAVFEFDAHQGRGWQQIVKWITRHTDRDHVLKGVEDVDHYLHDNDLNVVGLFPDGYNATLFMKSARHFDDVMFAEATGTEVSQQIAVHLAKHATYLCETIDFGPSRENAKSVELPREKMHCNDAPKNPQRQEWTDSFTAIVTGKQVTVNRKDSGGGWDQMLQLKCCDDENSTEGQQQHLVPVPSVVMFMPHDERFAVYDGDLADIHALDRWISARRSPMIMHLNQETAEHIFDTGPEKTPILFLIGSDSQRDAALEGVVKEAGKELRGRVVICFSGMNSQVERRLAEMAGAEEDQLPVLSLIESQQGGGSPFHSAKKYRLPAANLKASAVVEFITSYEKGTLKPWLRSEPVPGPEDMLGPVAVLVGTTFTESSQETEKDVLVDFYAPWCGHCRKFEPQYKALGKQLQHVKTLRITKIDATRNEIEGLMIQGFPTVILFPASAAPKKHVRYQGNRQPEDMIRWLHDHCTHPFDDRPPKVEKVVPVESGLLDPSEEDL